MEEVTDVYALDDSRDIVAKEGKLYVSHYAILLYTANYWPNNSLKTNIMKFY